MRKSFFMLFLIGIILLSFSSCAENDDKNLSDYSTEAESAERDAAFENTNAPIQISGADMQIKNTVVAQPVMNEVTLQISEKLVGRYELEDCPDVYFEIKPSGELEITVMTFDGIAEYKDSSELILTAFYQGTSQTTISFSLIGGENTFPEGYLSLDYTGDGDCTYFRRIDGYYQNEKYIKVDLDNSVSTTDADVETSYAYNLPQEVSDADFFSDRIEAEINWESISSEDLPAYIFEDMKNYSLGNSMYAQRFAEYGEPDCEFEYMLYDMNCDNSDDYIIKTVVKYAWNSDIEYFYKIYLAGENGGFMPITWDCVEMFHPKQYILKSETYGLKDIMVLHNSNYPIITYNGGDSYTPCEMIDERHTFIDTEILTDNILHLNMKVSVKDAPLGEYYTAIKFADDRYLKNNLLYSCDPKGEPCSYINKPYEQIGFSSAIEGYDFYVELTDEGVTAFTEEENVWRLLELLEIKYIAVDDD